MKQLTCEMCGSTDLLKQDGVFVCQTCGTKYSVEEAKKMMIEGTVNVSGTVKVDNTDKIKNYLEMANSAYEAGNKNEAESYCNRIIEIEPQNYEAWFMKGKAAGWQSTLANIRIEESVQCFSKAVDYAPEDKVDEIKNEAASEISSLSTALVGLPCNNFIEYPSADNASTIIDCATKAKEFALTLLIKCGKLPEEYERDVATLINYAAINAWVNSIKPEYVNDNDGHPTKYAFDTLLNQAGYCSSLIKIAIDFADNDDDNDAIRYENLIAINDFCITACSWKEQYGYENNTQAVAGGLAAGFGGSDGQHWYWAKEYTLTASAINSRKEENAKYRDLAQSCRQKGAQKQREEAEKKRKEQKDRNDAYWAEHSDEKHKLDSESVELHSKLEQLKRQMSPYDKEILSWKNKREAGTPAQTEKEKIELQISQLQLEISSLGIFKGKEKKELQSQIDSLKARIPKIKESIEQEEKEQIKFCNDKIREIEQTAQPIKDEIAKIEKRLNEINTELTKDR